MEASIVFVDMAGYTALTEAHGDDDAANLAELFYTLVARALAPPARLVKTIGDAVLIVAPSAALGLSAALAIAESTEREPHFPDVRAGLHFGPIVERRGDVFGATVNVAARVASHARGGQILATAAAVRGLAGIAAARFTAQGPVRFKNVAEPVEVFLVERDRPLEGLGAIDPVCRMRVDPARCIERLAPGGQRCYFCSAVCAESFARTPEAFVPAD